MVPEMSGGIFWEHLHRLVAGGLVLLWAVGTFYAYRTPAVSKPIRRWALAGVGLLLVQSVFGGLTVLLRLPDAISTTHLGLAFGFLCLASALTVASAQRPARSGLKPDEARSLAVATAGAATLVFVQSLVGGAVRHTDSGLACPDIPLCLGEWVPPLEQWPIALHFGHRALGIVALLTVLWVAWRGVRSGLRPGLYRTAAILVTAQVLLGFWSVFAFLAVVPVSLHTLVAASVLAALAAAATSGFLEARAPTVPVATDSTATEFAAR